MSRQEMLKAQLDAFKLCPTDPEINQLLRYVAGLEHWNRTINLTALKGAALVRQLVIEPLWVLDQISPKGCYLDIGSGNGSPAIPWHIRGGFVAAQLVESRSRRSIFLRQIARQIGLEKVTVHRGRFEALAAELQPANWITLQGVRLTHQLLNSIRAQVSQGATAVWFTKGVEPPRSPARVLEIPFSDRRALVFEL